MFSPDGSSGPTSQMVAAGGLSHKIDNEWNKLDYPKGHYIWNVTNSANARDLTIGISNI